MKIKLNGLLNFICFINPFNLGMNKAAVED